MISVTFLGLLVGVMSFLVMDDPAYSTAASGPSYSYSINGLTCSLPQGTSTSVGLLVQEVASTPRFLAATKGQPYAFAGLSNMTNRWETVKGVNVTLPSVIDLGFYNNGPSTGCGMYPHTWIYNIDVEVPIAGGTYNLANESVHFGGGSQ